MGSSENLLYLIRAVLWLKRRAVGLAFLLAIPSWFVLVGIWVHSSTGGTADRVLGGLLSPAYRAGQHVGQIIFPDCAMPRATLARCSLFGVMGEFLLLMLLCYIGIRVVRRVQGKEHERISGTSTISTPYGDESAA